MYKLDNIKEISQKIIVELERIRKQKFKRFLIKALFFNEAILIFGIVFLGSYKQIEEIKKIPDSNLFFMQVNEFLMIIFFITYLVFFVKKYYKYKNQFKYEVNEKILNNIGIDYETKERINYNYKDINYCFQKRRVLNYTNNIKDNIEICFNINFPYNVDIDIIENAGIINNQDPVFDRILYKTESIEFNKKYSVYASHPNLLTAILTPEYIDWFINFAKGDSGVFKFEIKCNKLIVTEFNNNDNFKLYKNMINIENVDNIMNKITLPYKIIDGLELYRFDK